MGQSRDGLIHPWDRFTLSGIGSLFFGWGQDSTAVKIQSTKMGMRDQDGQQLSNFNMDTKEIYLEETSNFNDSSNEEEKFDNGTTKRKPTPLTAVLITLRNKKDDSRTRKFTIIISKKVSFGFH